MVANGSESDQLMNEGKFIGESRASRVKQYNPYILAGPTIRVITAYVVCTPTSPTRI